MAGVAGGYLIDPDKYIFIIISGCPLSQKQITETVCLKKFITPIKNCNLILKDGFEIK
jgi:hypothetical protein